MSGAKVIYGRLVNTTAVKDLVGTRIRPMKSTQKDKNPRITYQLIGSDVPYSHDGHPALKIERWQIDAYAIGWEAVEELAAEIRKPSKDGGPLDGYRGATNTGGITVQAIYKESESDIDEGVIEGTDSMEARRSFDFELWIEGT